MTAENEILGDNAENKTDVNAATAVTDKIEQCNSKLDGIVNKALGLIGDHPWDSWLATAGKYIKRFTPLAIAAAGLLACITTLVMAISHDAPISYVINTLWMLVPAALAMILAPKAMALTESLISKAEPIEVRPEVISIMKIIFGLGEILTGLFLLLKFNGYLVGNAIASIIIGVLNIIVLSRPQIIGMKAGYPTNCVEEIIAIVMYPVRTLITLMTPVIGIGVVGGIIYGIVGWFDGSFEAEIRFGVTALAPFVLPFATYLAYLVVIFVIDICRAIVSIPRKIDELKR